MKRRPCGCGLRGPHRRSCALRTVQLRQAVVPDEPPPPLVFFEPSPSKLDAEIRELEEAVGMKWRKR